MKLCHLNKKLLLSPFIEGLYTMKLAFYTGVLKQHLVVLEMENFCINSNRRLVVNGGLPEKKNNLQTQGWFMRAWISKP